jgi:hypothetical protein
VAAPNAQIRAGSHSDFSRFWKSWIPSNARNSPTSSSTVYRPELIKRMNAEKGEAISRACDTIIDLTKLRNPAAGWKPLGKVPPSELVWRFKSFDPLTEKDQLPTREKNASATSSCPMN